MSFKSGKLSTLETIVCLMNYFGERVKPAVIVPRYDILKSISYDIYLGQDLILDQDLGQDLGQNLHLPNIFWIHNVNKTCLLDVTKYM